MLIPPAPAAAEWTEAEAPVRFEDVTQDGRLQLDGAMHALGRTGWRGFMRSPYAKPLFGQGIVPILTRLVAVGEGGPFGVDPDLRARGTFAFSHVPGAATEASAGSGALPAPRLLLGMWLEVRAPIGVVYGAPPARAGELAVAARVYAEHTLTRPFAPPGERRVTRVEVPGLEPVPGPPRERVVPSDVATPPAGASLLDPRHVEDEARVVFGMAHTDSNQHVNSIVYLRLFEEAALRRLFVHGVKGAHLVRRAHVAYVKPSFAGDVSRIHLRAYEHEGVFGAFGAFVPEGQSLDRATCFVHVAF